MKGQPDDITLMLEFGHSTKETLLGGKSVRQGNAVKKGKLHPIGRVCIG